MEETGPSGEPYYMEHNITKDKYRKIDEKEEHPQASENEIYVTNEGKPNKFYAYGTEYLLRNPEKDLRVKATGKAISKAFLISELIRKRVKGLHMLTKVDTTDSISRYEPIEEGLDPVSVTKKLSVVEILLSFKPLDVDHYGYQPPLEEKEVREITIDELVKQKQPRRKKGNFEKKDNEEEEGRRGGFQRRRGGGRGMRRGGGGHMRRPRSLSETHYSRNQHSSRRGGYRGGERGNRGFRGDRGDHHNNRGDYHGSRGDYQRDREERGDREDKWGDNQESREREQGERGNRGVRRGGGYRTRGGYRGSAQGSEGRESEQNQEQQPRTFQQRGRGEWRSRGSRNRGGYNRSDREEKQWEGNKEEEERGGFEKRGARRGGFRGRGDRDRQFRSRDDNDLYKVRRKGGFQQKRGLRKISGKGDEKAWFNKFDDEEEKRK